MLGLNAKFCKDGNNAELYLTSRCLHLMQITRRNGHTQTDLRLCHPRTGSNPWSPPIPPQTRHSPKFLPSCNFFLRV